MVVPLTGVGDDAVGSTMMDEGIVCVVKVAVPVGRMVCGPVVGNVCAGIEIGGIVEPLDTVSAEGVVTPAVEMLTDPEGLEFCVPEGLAVTETGALGEVPDGMPVVVDPVRGIVSVADPDVITV